MVDEFPQAQVPGECGRQEQAGIGHQAMVVKEDADTVGFVLWQHLLGAPCFRAGFCSKTIIPDSEERPLASSRAVPKAVLRWIRGKEYHRKTTGPHQMWATDASYFRVVGWSYYYLVTVMDDYSRFILVHRLQRDMTSDSFIEVVQEAVDRTGMDQIPITDRTRLLSDNGPGYVSRAFRDYLGMVGIKHILATPFHPQTNGKL